MSPSGFERGDDLALFYILICPVSILILLSLADLLSKHLRHLLEVWSEYEWGSLEMSEWVMSICRSVARLAQLLPGQCFCSCLAPMPWVVSTYVPSMVLCRVTEQKRVRGKRQPCGDKKSNHMAFASSLMVAAACAPFQLVFHLWKESPKPWTLITEARQWPLLRKPTFIDACGSGNEALVLDALNCDR